MPEILSKPQLLWSHGSNSQSPGACELSPGCARRKGSLRDLIELGALAARRPPRILRTQGNKQWGLPALWVSSKSMPTL